MTCNADNLLWRSFDATIKNLARGFATTVKLVAKPLKPTDAGSRASPFFQSTRRSPNGSIG